jgi:hypothetical protein
MSRFFHHSPFTGRTMKKVGLFWRYPGWRTRRRSYPGLWLALARRLDFPAGWAYEKMLPMKGDLNGETSRLKVLRVILVNHFRIEQMEAVLAGWSMKLFKARQSRSMSSWDVRAK